MKTLVFKHNKMAAHIFEDADMITVRAEHTETPNFNIGDMYVGNVDLIENVTPPDDWENGRYTFDGGVWTQVVGWKSVKEVQIENLEAELAALKAS